MVPTKAVETVLTPWPGISSRSISQVKTSLANVGGGAASSAQLTLSGTNVRTETSSPHSSRTAARWAGVTGSEKATTWTSQTTRTVGT